MLSEWNIFTTIGFCLVFISVLLYRKRTKKDLSLMAAYLQIPAGMFLGAVLATIWRAVSQG